MALNKEKPLQPERCRGFLYSVGAPGFEPGTSCSQSRNNNNHTTTICRCS